MDLLIIHRTSHIQKTSQTCSGPTTKVIFKVQKSIQSEYYTLCPLVLGLSFNVHIPKSDLSSNEETWLAALFSIMQIFPAQHSRKSNIIHFVLHERYFYGMGRVYYRENEVIFHIFLFACVPQRISSCAKGQTIIPANSITKAKL